MKWSWTRGSSIHTVNASTHNCMNTIKEKDHFHRLITYNIRKLRNRLISANLCLIILSLYSVDIYLLFGTEVTDKEKIYNVSQLVLPCALTVLVDEHVEQPTRHSPTFFTRQAFWWAKTILNKTWTVANGDKLFLFTIAILSLWDYITFILSTFDVASSSFLTVKKGIALQSSLIFSRCNKDIEVVQLYCSCK